MTVECVGIVEEIYQQVTKSPKVLLTSQRVNEKPYDYQMFGQKFGGFIHPPPTLLHWYTLLLASSKLQNIGGKRGH